MILLERVLAQHLALATELLEAALARRLAEDAGVLRTAGAGHRQGGHAGALLTIFQPG